MIDAKRIEEMKRLSAEAVEGPWLIGRSSPNGAQNVGTPHGLLTAQTTREGNAQFIAESRQFVPDIIAAYEEQAEEIDQLRLELRCSSTVQMEAIKKQAEEIAKLRKALEFYADEDNYGADVHYNGLGEPIYWKSIAENDEGDIAREALK